MRFLAAVSLALLLGQSLQTPMRAASCLELLVASERLDCLRQRLPSSDLSLLPDVLAFLSTNPQAESPPLPWLQVLGQPDKTHPAAQKALLKQLAAALAQPQEPVIQQHLLRLFQYLRIAYPQQLDSVSKDQVLQSARRLSSDKNPLTRLLARDLLLMQSTDRALLKQTLAGSPAERALALLYIQKWQADPKLKPQLPVISAQQFLDWAHQPDLELPELKAWTFHKAFQESPPGSLHDWLGIWLESAQPDTVRLGEQSLILLLKHEQPSLRAYALKRLALSGNPAYAKAIEALLDDSDPAVRLRAHDALAQLHKLSPLQDLALLKDPKKLPADAERRIQSLLRNPEHQAKLLEPAYAHLARLPVFQAELWRLLEQSADLRLQLKVLKALAAAPASWPLSRLNTLLAVGQDVRLRNAALGLALKRPYSPEVVEFLRPLVDDPQTELQLEILNYLFVRGMASEARGMLDLLAKRSQQRLDRQLLSFDGQPGSAKVDDYIQDHLNDWIKKADPRFQNLPDWLSWIRDPALPLSWRRTVLRLTGNQGKNLNLIGMLEQLMQEPELEMDAEFALEAIKGRLML